jgi:hypothetical protein
MGETDAAFSRWQAGETNRMAPPPGIGGFAENFVNQGVHVSPDIRRFDGSHSTTLTEKS